MPSPFPGMDPYLEAQGAWPDFQLGLIAACRAYLNQVLPPNDVARMDEELRLVETESFEPRAIRPEVAVVAGSRGEAGPTTDGGPTSLEAVTLALATTDPAEVREVWVEIIRLPEREVVTVIELLSPTSKRGQGRSVYLEKRKGIVESPVHLVEIDLLVEGRRPPMRGDWPPGHYYSLVSRADRRPDAEVYSWDLRSPLPTVPIPLSAGDADVRLDLAAIFAQVYEEGRYPNVLRYDRPLELEVSSPDRAWAESLAHGRGSLPPR